MRVNGIFGCGNGTVPFFARDRVEAIEPGFATADEEGPDASGDVVNHLSLSAGRMAEIPGSFPGSTKTIAAC